MDTNVIKTYKDIFASPLTNLINMPISQNRVPSSWNIANITPVLKAGDKTNF